LRLRDCLAILRRNVNSNGHTYSVVTLCRLFIQESITSRLSDDIDGIISDKPSASASGLPFFVGVNVCCSSALLSPIGPITVDSDEGILSVGCNEFVLSLLELSVIVDDSARDDADWTCCCASADSDGVSRCRDSSVVEVSSSLMLGSVSAVFDCEAIFVFQETSEIDCRCSDVTYQ
jgi:hypothetical protein